MNIGTIGERKRDKIDSGLSYSPSLEVAVKLILGDPAFAGDRGNAFVQVPQSGSIPQKQCSSRVSDSRDGYRGEERHGPLAVGSVGLIICSMSWW
jgi:hypothetical protein